MTLFNLENRLKHWSTGWTNKNQGNSRAIPFLAYLNVFCEKYVLEIGPGEGRQFDVVQHLADVWSIADISIQVLNCPKYENVERFLLQSYNENVGGPYDLIHFWYVLHHIPTCEINDFISFLCRHLTKQGLIFFNSPYLGFDKGAYADDGVGTSPYDFDTVMKLFTSKFDLLIADGRQIGRSNGFIFLFQRKGAI